MNKRLNWMRMLILCICIGLAVCFLHTDVKATGTDGGQTEYTITRVKKKIQMLRGETRMISTIIPPDSTFESSNAKIVSVANNGQAIANKAGTVTITHTTGTEKIIYTVKVNDEVDLIVFAGQSNMCGSGGNKAQAPTPEYGTAYEYDITTKSKKCIRMKEPFGEGTNRSKGVEDNKTYSTSGTLVSAFCINYYKQTKTPVVAVSSACGGSSTNTWLNRGLVKETQKRLKLAKKYLKKNKIKIRHIYMVWYQGESDAQQAVSAKTYMSRMKKIYRKMKKTGVEKVFMIRIGYDAMGPRATYSTIMSAQKKLCSQDKNFILVSKKASGFMKSYRRYYSDNIHINQKGLNKIGYEAGKAAGKYAKKHSKK
nr:hypothetical protein [Lachnospiraceae bacterium]